MRALRRFSLLLAAAILGGCVEAPTAIESPQMEALLSSNARTVPITVMSRNLYLGAELGPLFALENQNDIPFAVAALWANVVHNDFPTRAKALADEVAATDPQLIGLQEVAFYRITDGSGSIVSVLDYLSVLLDALHARGLDYRIVTSVDNIDITFPIFLPPAALGYINFLQRDVILARADVQTSNPAAGNYAAMLSVEAAGVPIEIPRGWTAVDATRDGVTIRFVNTHLEAFHALYNGLQARELAAILAAEQRSVVLVGDINSGPRDPYRRPAYQILRRAGFLDAWALTNQRVDGFTCCFPELLSEVAPGPDQRVDVVLFRQPQDGSGVLVPVSTILVGGELDDRVWSPVAGALLWPSDHLGVVGTLHYRSLPLVGPPAR